MECLRPAENVLRKDRGHITRDKTALRRTGLWGRPRPGPVLPRCAVLVPWPPKAGQLMKEGLRGGPPKRRRVIRRIRRAQGLLARLQQAGKRRAGGAFPASLPSRLLHVASKNSAILRRGPIAPRRSPFGSTYLGASYIHLGGKGKLRKARTARLWVRRAKAACALL